MCKASIGSLSASISFTASRESMFSYSLLSFIPLMRRMDLMRLLVSERSCLSRNENLHISLCFSELSGGMYDSLNSTSPMSLRRM